jgi:digeranylgeranylglycerophospholipid reductase
VPSRKTKRGLARTALAGDYDAVVCGASFAGLTVARELAGARRGGEPARVLVLDRYDVGERQTSACGIPTVWLEALGLEESIDQTFGDLLVHTPHGSSRWRLPWTFSTFDYRTLCRLLRDQGDDAEFETATVSGRTGEVVHTDRGDVSAHLVVDALGWRRVLAGDVVQPPEAFLSRGLEIHPDGRGEDLELWIDRGYVRAGYAWSFPADGELRVGVGSFEPRDHVKEPTVRLAGDLALPPVRYQGNWIPHRIRPATEDGVFFAGDSAGHCIPTTAEGIRTALYFGLACGRELRAVVAGRRTRAEALRAYHEFSARHRWKFEAMLKLQDLFPRLPPRVLRRVIDVVGRQPVTDWAFRNYLRIAPPPPQRAPAPALTRRPATVTA